MIENCSICLEDINNDFTITGCGHSFHKECLHNIYIINSTCPNCRTLLCFCYGCKIYKTIENTTFKCLNENQYCDICDDAFFRAYHEYASRRVTLLQYKLDMILDEILTMGDDMISETAPKKNRAAIAKVMKFVRRIAFSPIHYQIPTRIAIVL